MNKKYSMGNQTRHFVMLAVLSFLTACSSVPADKSAGIEDTSGAVDVPQKSSAVTDALRRYQKGDYAGAASQYQRLANQAGSSGASISDRLSAADAFARAGQNALALDELKKLNGLALNDQQHLRAKITEAQMALNSKRPREVFNMTPSNAEQFSLDTQVRLGQLRSDSWLALGRDAEAIMERIDIDPIITDPAARTLNHQWIWNQLQAMPRDNVFSPPSGMSQDDAGWWSLAAIVKKGDYQRAGQNELDIWRQTYPGHPATEDILFFIESGSDVATTTSPRDLADPSQVPYTGTVLEGTPRQVALLLPLSGAYEKAGRAVLSGFRESADRASLGYVDFKVYDSADPSYSTTMIAEAAIQNGAEMIVGPLQKDQLGELLAKGNLGVPVLGLNQLTNQSGDGLFQYSLSPENDAAEVARKAIADGRYRAAVLASQDAIGERIANAFMREFEQNGGSVIAYDGFAPNTNTLSQVVKRLLRADSADPLWEDVRKGTNRTSNSDQKIDMIFFTASPRDSRILRPVVQLQRAYDLPVYSSSRVYGQPDPTMDADLEGLIFCDMPVRLRGGGGNPLRAMGHDAYILVNSLEDMSRNPGVGVPGETGRLSLNYNGVVERELDCAVFRKGQPALLN